MIYNTSREAIIIREYGRNIQRYVNFTKTIQDKKQRQTAAENIIDMMLTLNPQLKQSQDYQKKLWTHLFIMADYNLDVDCPYDDISHTKEVPTPPVIPYPQAKIQMKHYGKNIESLIQKAIEAEDEEQKKEIVQIIANFMKMAYLTWSNEEVDNKLIKADIKALSKGQLKIHDDIEIEISASVRNENNNNMKKRNGKRKPGRNNKNRRNNR
ncbi:MAG: DUF4290 domain-containing protein [Chitinophagales bacterium]|nr:DUF4290 domain-containing protein [Chitinophagales bacterium]